MALRNQKQVMGLMDNMAGRAMGRVGKSYQRSTIRPMVGRIKGAKSLKGLLRQLGPMLLRKMDTAMLEKTIAETQVQSALIGRTTAKPRETSKGESRKVESRKVEDGPLTFNV